jgi:glycosidase
MKGFQYLLNLIFASAFLLVSCQINSQVITDVIKPINTTAGKSTTVILSDVYYAENYNPKLLTNKNLTALYSAEENKLTIIPNNNFEGMTLLEFKVDGNVYSIPVKSKKEKYYLFTFKPSKKYDKINLFGSFNGWNRHQIPMLDEDNDGVYEAEAALEPGVYQYKFFADGKELIDPDNPVKVSNGMGDYNSVRTIAESEGDKLFLHIQGKREEGDKSIFDFSIEFGAHYKFEKENVIALLNNSKIDTQKITLLKNHLSIELKTAELKGENLLRTAAVKNGAVSNIQTIFLFDGKPADNKNFTWYDGIIYSLMIDRFNDGDKSLNNPVEHDSLADKANYMGGDLKGIIDKLEEGYFDSLGINTLWISPVNDNPNEPFREYPAPHRYYTGYHGYWPIDDKRVEEKFGTIDDVKKLVETAHKKNIKVLLDFVSNHVHEQHPFYQNNKDWFGTLELPDGRLNLRFWDEFRLTTWFEPYMPSFDYLGSEEAIETMIDNAAWWLTETGADGFRHDAVKHVPNKFWRELTRKLKSKVGSKRKLNVYQIGETFGSYDLISSYVNNGQLSSQFNFNLYDVAIATFINDDSNFDVLNKEMQKSFNVYGELNLMGNIMDSHDKNRFMAYADGDLDVTQWSAIEEGWNNPPKVDDPESYKKLILYMAYMNTIPGLPVIYYGSEFGMTGASDPDNRRMMRFDESLTEDEMKTRNEVSKIINLRKNNSALRYGDFYTLKAAKNIFAYTRSDANERLLIVLNKSIDTKRVSVTLPAAYQTYLLEDLITGEKVPSERDAAAIVVDGMSWRVFRLGK